MKLAVQNIFEMKNILGVIINKLDSAEKNVSDLEDIAVEFIHIEAHREKRMKDKYEQRISKLWNDIKLK